MAQHNDSEARIQSAMRSIPENRYPIVIELAGMPRLGKTTFTDSLIDLLKRSGFATMLSSFATHSSPIHDRWSFEFTAWTLFSFLKGYLELRQSTTHFIVADRGLFDSLTWLRVKAERGLVKNDAPSTLRSMTLMKPWFDSLCLVLVFTGDSELILRRHRQRRLYKGESLVSTVDVLPRLQFAIRSEAEVWMECGIRVEFLHVGDDSIEVMNSRAAEHVISSLEAFAKDVEIQTLR